MTLEHIRLSSPDTNRAAGLCLTDGERVLLLRRASHITEPNKWTVPGGHLKEGEDELEGAIRETREEAGYVPPHEVIGSERIGPFTLIYALVEKRDAGWKPLLDIESTDAVWADGTWIRANWNDLHPGMKTALSTQSLFLARDTIDNQNLSRDQLGRLKRFLSTKGKKSTLEVGHLVFNYLASGQD